MKAGRAAVLLAVSAVALSGCAAAESSPAVATPTPTALPSPTPAVAFAIQVTPLPTATPPRPRPTPTRVVHHVGPYIVLLPSSGPPEARQIVVVGGNLPTSTQVMLMWSPNGRTSPISTTAYTSRTGALRSQFFVPGTVPGDYSIVAQVNGAPYASARYRVRSFAALSVATKLAGGSVRLGVSGRRFLPDTTLILLLYSAQGAIKPVQLGRVTTNGKGAFSRWLPSRHLPAGQYVLRAWPTGPLAAQTVDTYFQVIL